MPPIEFGGGLDMILLDLPSRFLGMMPNGLGYVHNLLVKTGIKVQTMDLDLIFYHRFHSERLLDGAEKMVAPSGYVMQDDPWAVDRIEDEWGRRDVVEFFRRDLDELMDALVAARPKMIGISTMMAMLA